MKTGLRNTERWSGGSRLSKYFSIVFLDTSSFLPQDLCFAHPFPSAWDAFPQAPSMTDPSSLSGLNPNATSSKRPSLVSLSEAPHPLVTLLSVTLFLLHISWRGLQYLPTYLLLFSSLKDKLHENQKSVSAKWIPAAQNRRKWGGREEGAWIGKECNRVVARVNSVLVFVREAGRNKSICQEEGTNRNI